MGAAMAGTASDSFQEAGIAMVRAGLSGTKQEAIFRVDFL
jgi:hypothetical protein